MRADQSDSREFAGNFCGGPPFVEMSWSPTGDRIIGDCNTLPRPRHQYVINVEDGTYYSLDQRWGRTATGADWSAVGDRILYVALPDGYYGRKNVHVANLDGSADALVVADAFQPKWSPDATRIAFVREFEVSRELGNITTTRAIFIANADGSGVRQLTFPATFQADSNPAWSPDGMSLAFHRNQGEASDVVVVKVDGGGYGYRIVTPDSLSGFGPDW